MLELITCLIETVKSECSPVEQNAQIDRLNDWFDHCEGDWEVRGHAKRRVFCDLGTRIPRLCAAQAHAVTLQIERAQTRFPRR
ncbi:hypothetical protein M0D69_36455 [Caballeronia sp. SEWSISQ10-4 2]|uniref:hypothetical protein n=1 Tax=Caballeronia sp. SEWSISQ10-4 2 TaxID=2937438 RepID=UPI00264EBAD8|nr:hypothetical protein [Caballeronia sp. SEWSISQ10-4 2]MDN7183407.1 hypothetical protein [Caballeronia sp. SEWSISQ10-4 2]